MAKRKGTKQKQEIPASEAGQPMTPVEAPLEPGSEAHRPAAGFPIVGIGASAGGLAAIEAFFAALPSDQDTGMAFVLVQHLDPDHKSILIDLVRKYTRMPVFKVEDGMKVEPNCAYIIPPNRDMAFLDGKLHLLEPGAPRGLRLPIDFFFRSLAQDQHERAICIVLSGTGTDGTLGLKAVKGEGGMAIVQSPESAAYDGMPRSAIATGLVDYVLPPDKMPEQLIAYVKHAFGQRPKPVSSPPSGTGDALQKVFILLRARTGHDFSHYKQNTICRRIERRMAVAQIDRIEDYVRYLRDNPLEVESLFRELLIGVTNFFRDPEAFQSLRGKIIPRLFADKPPGAGVRVWVPGCSSGEEAFSLAILIREYLDELKENFQVQIFATDIDTEAIEKARSGVYPESIAADVSPERLSRFFTQEDNSYHINKNIRDLVVFAPQDVLKDPPFSKMDLISCRNLLIYLEVETQKKIFPLFHYALNQDGYLFLGNSETIGEFITLYAVVDKKWKIYRRKGELTPHAAIGPYMPPLETGVTRRQARPGDKPAQRDNVRQLTERVLLEDYAPASLLVNAEFEVLYIHGSTGRYLEPATGEASLNLLRMAREGLRMELTAGVRKALTQQKSIRYEGLQVKNNGDRSVVNLIIRPVIKPDAEPSLAMVIFEEVTNEPPKPLEPSEAPLDGLDHQLTTLKRELRAKEEYLQTTVEELETTNEELTSANEELQSVNEELQSTNEELETSKEELQSINEELVTVNTELQKKIEDLSKANNDMNNLMAGTNIGTLFLDLQLRIQRFTPATTSVINFIQTDLGRPVGDIVSRFKDYDRLVPDTQAVLDTLIPKEEQVQTREGQWFQMLIQPYRTLENVIEGVVLTFVDITEQKKLQMAVAENEEKLRTLFEILPVAVSVLDARGRIIYVNPALEKVLDVPRADLLRENYRQPQYLRPDGRPMPLEESAGFRAFKEQRLVEHVETCLVMKDGRVIRTDMSAMPLALQGWKVVVVTFDLSARSLSQEKQLKPEGGHSFENPSGAYK
ncbi:MAG: PAS domain-containing protein [Deltaproteobacteria bacterium]|nr:PAS domain-containing protein [Deltaproteobacteria bacterium]